MKPKIAKKFTYWLEVAAIGIVLGLILQGARAWTEPGETPPSGNLGAPINTSGNAQVKAGTLGVNSDGNPIGLLVGGNAGIGTTAPNTLAPNSQPGNLDVNDVWLRNGDKWVSQQEGADYDSGWYAENSSTSHKTTLTHNLGAIPTRIQIWFSPDNPPSDWVYPVSADSAYYTNGPTIGYYRSPVSIRMNATVCELNIYGSVHLYVWTEEPGHAYTVYNTGFYRVRLWK